MVENRGNALVCPSLSLHLTGRVDKIPYPTNAAPISHPKVQLATLLRISLMLPSSRSNESVEESARHSIEICKNEDTLLRSQEPMIQVT